MILDHAGREFARFTPSPPSNDQFQASFDRGVTWNVLTPGIVDVNGNWLPSLTGTVHAIPVAGPDAANNPTGTVVLPLGTTQTKVMDASGAEIIIRGTGRIVVTP